ncbi:MAG: hypothetical protein AABZ12_06470 [Planctomycetota bacterium]
MKISWPVKWGMGLALLVTALGVLRFRPWEQAPATEIASQRPALRVGFLPVT